MNRSVDLLKQESHFAFGKNWASYAGLVTETQVREAAASLSSLAGGELRGKRFLDIGCGSGLHALAALRLGAREVVATDLDPDSVATTRRLLQAHAAGEQWSVLETSVFDLQPQTMGGFDVVYSWGVLHHTGDMQRALRTAAALLAPRGLFIFALYRRTYLCWLWKLEKRWYARAGQRAQARTRAVYVGLRRLAHALLGRGSFARYVAEYPRGRGMDFEHDVHDWLGGWPYESISPAETEQFMRQLGMRQVRSTARARRSLGLFGSGCDEYVYTWQRDSAGCAG